MRAQVREQGRYLGGRPPNGYRLVDGGPHPNWAHAEWGRRLRRLEPDPQTASHVRWMFERRLEGSVASIARELTERGVPCPSEVGPGRNAHRRSRGWALRTVAVILANPRHTGRQVWDRQRTERPGERASRRSGTAEWTISMTAAHPALISEAEFAAQRVRAARPTSDGRPVGTCCPGYCSAPCVVVRWTRTGYTAALGTLAGMATPAPGGGGRPVDVVEAINRSRHYAERPGPSSFSSSRTRPSMSSRIRRIRSMPSIPRSDGSSVSQMRSSVPGGTSTSASRRE